MCVCLSVGLSAFYRPHYICPLCGAASEYSESSQAVAGGPTRAARASMHTARARARAYRTTSQRKNRSADAFQKQLAVRARASCRIRNCRDFQKKREKENQHATSQVQFTVCLLLDLIFGRSRPWSARIVHKVGCGTKYHTDSTTPVSFLLFSKTTLTTSQKGRTELKRSLTEHENLE